MHRYLLPFLLAPLVLCAQPTATQISDFGYGNRGESILISQQVADGQLYGAFFRFFGADGAGLLATIDPDTGAPTALLDPDRTANYAGLQTDNIPNVFSVDGMTFGLQRDLATGNNLYRIANGEATLLLSAPNLSFSEMVLLGDYRYFVIGNVEAELWRTDGTPAGTTYVATLPETFDEEHTRLVVGTDKLLISIADADRGRQGLYVYDPAEDRTEPIRVDGESLVLHNVRFDRELQPVAYHNGAFFVYGGRSPERSGTVQRIPEITLIPEPLVIPLPPGIRRRYDEGNFFFFREQLYLQTGAARSVEGDDLFRVDTALTSIFYTPEIETFGFISDNFQPAVTADSLFFLARTSYDTATLYAYTGTMNSPQPVFSLFSTGEGLFGDPIWTEITERYLYLAVPNDDKLYRRNRLSGRIEAVDVSFGVWDPNTTVSPLSLLNGDLYFLHQGNATFPTPGLYRWRADAEQPRVLGDFALPFAFPRPVPWGNSVVQTDSLFRFRAETETLVGIRAPTGIRENSLRLLGDYGERALVSGRRLPDQQQRLLRPGEDSFVEYPVFLADTLALVGDNTLTDLRRLNDSTFTALLRVVEENALVAVLGRLLSSEIELTALQVFTSTRSRQLFAADDKIVLNLGRSGANGQEIFVYDNTGAELSSVVTEQSGRVRGITATGFFVEGAQDFSFYLFSAPDAPFVMPFSGVSPVPNATNFYVLDNKLLFVADAPATGREWYAARPEIGRIIPLRDIQSGPAFGTNYLTGFSLGDRLLFTANDGVHGAEPWVTDETSAGTRMVADLNPGPGSSNPSAYTLVDTSLYFTANGPNGYEAYRTGVEVLRPELFVDLYPGPESGHPYGYTVRDGRLYLYGRRKEGQTNELFRIAEEPTGIAAQRSGPPVRTFPNPVGAAFLTVNAPGGEELRELLLYDGWGRLLRRVEARGAKAQVPLNGLPAGRYWLRSRYASGRFSVSAVSRVQ